MLCFCQVIAGIEMTTEDKMKIYRDVLYILLPHNIIPDNIYFIGFTDDLAALTIVW